jgi:hypothetical protein
MKASFRRINLSVLSIFAEEPSILILLLLENRLQTRMAFTSGEVKGKASPLQAWSGPDGSRKLRFPDYMTTTQDGGKVVSLTHRPPLPPGNAPGTHFF